MPEMPNNAFAWPTQGVIYDPKQHTKINDQDFMTRFACLAVTLAALSACKVRHAASTASFEGGSALDVSKADAKSVCKQNILIFYTGNAETLGSVEFNAREGEVDELAFGKAALADWRTAERWRDWDYAISITDRVEDLLEAEGQDETACKKLWDAEGEAAQPGSVTLIALTDGPNFTMDEGSGVATPVEGDSKLGSWHFSYQRTAGAWQWGLKEKNSWMIEDNAFKALSAKPWETMLPDAYLFVVQNLEFFSSRYLGKGKAFSQTNYLFKSHSAPLFNRTWSRYPHAKAGNLPGLLDLMIAPDVGGVPEAAFLLDSRGGTMPGVEETKNQLFSVLWSPTAICQTLVPDKELDRCIAERRVQMGKRSPRSAHRPRLVAQAAGNPTGTQAAGNPTGTQAAGNPTGTQAAGNPTGTQAAGNPTGTQAAGNPTGTQAAGNPTGTQAAGNPTGTQAAGNPTGTQAAGNPTGTQAAGNPTGTQAAGNPTGTQAAGNPTGTQAAGNPTGTQAAGNPTGTQAAGNPTGTQAAGNPTGTQGIDGLSLGEGAWTGGTQNSKGVIFWRAGSADDLRLIEGALPKPEAFRMLGKGLVVSLDAGFPTSGQLDQLKYRPGTDKATFVLFDTCYGIPGELRQNSTLLGAEPGRAYDVVSVFNPNPLMIDALNYKDLNGFRIHLLAEQLAHAIRPAAPDQAIDAPAQADLKKLLNNLEGDHTALPEAEARSYKRLLANISHCTAPSEAGKPLACEFAVTSPVIANWDRFYERLSLARDAIAAPHRQSRIQNALAFMQNFSAFLSFPDWARIGDIDANPKTRRLSRMLFYGLDAINDGPVYGPDDATGRTIGDPPSNTQTDPLLVANAKAHARYLEELMETLQKTEYEAIDPYAFLMTPELYQLVLSEAKVAIKRGLTSPNLGAPQQALSDFLDDAATNPDAPIKAVLPSQATRDALREAVAAGQTKTYEAIIESLN